MCVMVLNTWHQKNINCTITIFLTPFQIRKTRIRLPFPYTDCVCTSGNRKQIVYSVVGCLVAENTANDYYFYLFFAYVTGTRADAEATDKNFSRQQDKNDEARKRDCSSQNPPT